MEWKGGVKELPFCIKESATSQQDGHLDIDLAVSLISDTDNCLWQLPLRLAKVRDG
jgi:hypothetical protein